MRLSMHRPLRAPAPSRLATLWTSSTEGTPDPAHVSPPASPPGSGHRQVGLTPDPVTGRWASPPVTPRTHATRGPATARARTFSPSRLGLAWLPLPLPLPLHAIETEARINPFSTTVPALSRRPASRSRLDPPPVSSPPGRLPPFPRACALAGWVPDEGVAGGGGRRRGGLGLGAQRRCGLVA